MKKLLLVLAVMVVLGILTAIVGILLSGVSPGVTGDRVLTLTIDQPITDYSVLPKVPFLDTRSPQSLVSLLGSLTRARQDDRVLGLALTLKNAKFGLAKAQEIRALLRSFSEEGKFVNCYLETAGEGANGTLTYYLATACDRISLAPAADFNLVGLFADSMFLRGTLDKLLIEPQFQHVGEFKSAAEMYTEFEHSPAAEMALSSVLDDLYAQIVTAIASSRDLDTSLVRSVIDSGPLSPEQALRHGLVDELAFPDEFESSVRKLVGAEPEFVPLSNFDRSPGVWRSTKIAVVFVQGTIVRGKGGVDLWTQQHSAGSDTFAEIFRDLADRDDVAAVVLRINSPGGSPLASDLMLREIGRLAARKPVVVSMSDLAASGGYYIAAAATKIVASPATLTGSIGVVGGKLATGRFQRELLGISHDMLKRGENADFFSSVEPFSADQATRYQQLMTGVYDRFVGHVATGRSMSEEQVRNIAGGRVWTGAQARERGLVDALGGIEAAIRLAREEAGIDPDVTDTGLLLLPRPQSILEYLGGGATAMSAAARFDPLQRLQPRNLYWLEVPPGLARLASPF